MSRYDYPDPGLDSSYCDGLSTDGPDDNGTYPDDHEPYRCFWCDRLLSVSDASDYCSALCANYALVDSEER
jgi:hypothetical protein